MPLCVTDNVQYLFALHYYNLYHVQNIVQKGAVSISLCVKISEYCKAMINCICLSWIFGGCLCDGSHIGWVCIFCMLGVYFLYVGCVCSVCWCYVLYVGVYFLYVGCVFSVCWVCIFCMSILSLLCISETNTRRAYQFIGRANMNQFMRRRNQIELFCSF